MLGVSEVNIWALLQRIICTSRRKAVHFSLLKVFLCVFFFLFLIEQLKIVSVGSMLLPSEITPLEGKAFI